MTDAEYVLLELAHLTLEFVGLDETAVTVELDDTYRSKGLDGTAWLGRGKPVIKLDARLGDDLRHAAGAILHEAAHVLSGDASHDHRFQEQWSRLTTKEFLAGLQAHLSDVSRLVP